MDYPLSLNTLLFIPSISNANFFIDGIHLKNFVSSYQYINSNIIEPLLNQALSKATKLLLNIDLLLNIRGIADNVCQGFTDPSKDGLTLAAGTSMRLGENIFVAASSLVNAISIESPGNEFGKTKIGLNQNAEDTVKSGFKSFGNSLITGSTGIFVDPYKGLKKEGVKGFFKGLGSGITGIVTKPVSGLVDVGSGLIVGARKAIENDKNVFNCIRYSKPLLMKKIQPFNEIESKIFRIIQKSNIEDGSYKELINFLFIHLNNYIIFTNKSIYYLDNNFNIINKIFYKDINKYNFINNSFIINKIKFNIENDFICKILNHFIFSKRIITYFK